MSNPLKRLIKSLSPSTTTTGKVIARGANSISVVTSTGVTTIQVSSAQTYAIGDDIAVRDGVIVGKMIKREGLPVFRV